MPNGISIIMNSDLGELPIFSSDLEGSSTPAAVERLAEQVNNSDGLIVSNPEYARGIAGGLKKLFDWLTSRFEIIDKPILIVHASHRGDMVLKALYEDLSTLSKSTMPDVSIRIPLASYSVAQVEETIMRPEFAELIS